MKGYNHNIENMIESKYLVFDVETPNRKNDTICQIGLVLLDKEFNIISTKEFLINPESNFDFFNIRIHSITPVDVKDKCNFKVFWDEYKDLFYSNILVAHGAPFDLSVLQKQLKKFDIDFNKNDFIYIDTLSICSSKCCFTNNKLKTICEEISISQLEAHDALNDAIMCAKVLKYLVNNNIDINEKRISLKEDAHDCNSFSNEKYSDLTIRIQELILILQKYIDDGYISDREIETLYEWLCNNQELNGTYQYDELYDCINLIFEDGTIDENEREIVKERIEKIINPKESNDFFMPEDTKLIFNGNKFVITGEFSSGLSREEITNKIIERGGVVSGSVSKKTNYLIVGSGGSSDYKFGNYGSKITKAIDICIPIISETTFLKNLSYERQD